MPKKIPLKDYAARLPDDSWWHVQATLKEDGPAEDFDELRNAFLSAMKIDAFKADPETDINVDLDKALELGQRMAALTKSGLPNVVLVYEGDFNAEALQLDFQALDEDVGLIVVEGNCRIEKLIYSRETEGAPGLMVFGDLYAGNMAVGGQEIYVHGNLTVPGPFWGDYNHGEVIVKGDTVCDVIIAKDYSVKFEGDTDCRAFYRVPGKQDEYDFSEFLIETFAPEFHYEVDGFEYLSSGDVIKSLLAGEQVYTLKAPPVFVPLVDVSPSIENLRRLKDSILLDPLTRDWVMHSHARGFQIRVSGDGFVAQRDGLGSIAINEDNGILITEYSAKPDKVSSWKSLPTETDISQFDKWRLSKFVDWAEQSFAMTLQAFHQLEPAWQDYHRLVTVERIEETLSYDWTRRIGYFGDNNAIWIGNCALSFLHGDYVSQTGDTFQPEVRIARSHDDLDMEYFSFELAEHEGNRTVVLSTRSGKYWDDGNSKVTKCDPFCAATAKTATKLFDRAYRLMKDDDFIEDAMRRFENDCLE